MNKTKTLPLVLLTLAGCSMMKGKGDDTGGGGGGGGGEKSLAGNMAEAQTFSIGESLKAPAECHTSGYMKIDAPAGEAFQIVVGIDGPEGSCVDVSYLNSNGGSQNGGQMFGELCEGRTLDVTGLEGGAFLQVSEAGACKGASIELALQ